MLRVITARLHRPPKHSWPETVPLPKVSVVSPVYNEDMELWERSLNSWAANGVDEIICVIDKTNTHHIVTYTKKFMPRKDVIFRLVVTPKPGKRAALCDGMAALKPDTEIVALADSDTFWDNDVVEKTLPYFLNPQIGGATITQRIDNPRSTEDILFDILLWTRYREEVPFLMNLGKALNTLSGRTAFYRASAIFDPAHDNLHQLQHEYFLGTKGVSGDDKRLTHLLLEQQWEMAYVHGTQVYTQGLGSMRKFVKQRIRWTRNNWRGSLRAVRRGWIFRHPTLAYFIIDGFIQPFVMLLGPIAAIIAVVAGQYYIAGILIAWWLVSRFIKLFGYFREHPKRIVYLPAYILYTYLNAIGKIYALATTVENTWATRWDKKRLIAGKNRLRRATPFVIGSTAVALFLLLPYSFVASVHRDSGAAIPVPEAVTRADLNNYERYLPAVSSEPVKPLSALDSGDVANYTIAPGDTLDELALRFNMPLNDLKRLNGIKSANKISAGSSIIYYQPKAN